VAPGDAPVVPVSEVVGELTACATRVAVGLGADPANPHPVRHAARNRKGQTERTCLPFDKRRRRGRRLRLPPEFYHSIQTAQCLPGLCEHSKCAGENGEVEVSIRVEFTVQIKVANRLRAHCGLEGALPEDLAVA
jgi:hypothetical protein